MGRTVVRENLLLGGPLASSSSLGPAPTGIVPESISDVSLYFATIPSAATSVLHKRASAQTSPSVMLSLSDVQHLNNGSSFLWLLLFELFLWGPWSFELCGLCSA